MHTHEETRVSVEPVLMNHPLEKIDAIEPEILGTEDIQVTEGTQVIQEPRNLYVIQVPEHREEPTVPEGFGVRPSGFREGLRAVGRVAGIITWPIWRPVVEMARDTQRILDARKIPAVHLSAWISRFRSDLEASDAWTEAEHRSVVRQKFLWIVGLLLSAITALSLPGWVGFGPLMAFSLTWWLRSHNTRIPFHFDVVRWLLRLPQLNYGDPHEN